MKSRMTIGTKLMLSVGSLLVLILGLDYASLRAIGILRSHLDETANNTAKKVELAGEMKATVAEMRKSARGAVLGAVLKDEAELRTSHEEFTADAQKLNDLLKQFRPLLVTERGKQLTQQAQESVTQWASLENQMIELCNHGRIDEANQLRRNEQTAAADAVTKIAGEILDLQRELLGMASASGLAAAAANRWIALTLLGIAMSVGAVVIIGTLKMKTSIRQLVKQMAEGAEQVAGAAAQVASSSSALAQGASEQAATLEQTSASSEEINSMTHKNTENSRDAAKLTVQVDGRVAAANETLEQMVLAMGEINASSDKISKIIKVIDEIAFQTNILALNAAVEAARAGNAGMGFAVVADEVRNLAQRSSQAARDTAALIAESISKSNGGKEKLDHVAEAIQSITTSMTQVKTLVEEVHVSSQEQARGIEEISKGFSQMEQVTQNAAASAEESAAASEELSSQAETVRSIVAQLTAMVGSDEDRKPVVTQKAQVTARPAKAMPKPRPAHATAKARKSEFELDQSFREF